MSASEWRRKNLNYAYKKFAAKRKKEGLEERGTKTRFAEASKMSLQLMSNILQGQKTIGAALARKIEERLGMPTASLDLNPKAILTKNNEEWKYLDTCQGLYWLEPEMARAKLHELVVEMVAKEEAKDAKEKESKK